MPIPSTKPHPSFTIQPPADRVIKMPEVIGISGKSRTSIYREMDEGTFPRSFSTGSRSVGWSYLEVLAWIEECASKREGANHD